MKIDIQKFLDDAGVSDAFYPGKRLVVPYRQSGDFKSHSVILDWRSPDKVRIEIKAGLSGRDLEAKILKNYPVSFQSPTFVDIEIISSEEDDAKGKSSSSSSSGGGKQPKKAKSAAMKGMANAFEKIAEGKIPNAGEVKEMVIMGKEIAKEAFESVFEALKGQMQHAKVCCSELLSKAGDYVTRYTPPSFMEPKGDEQKPYKYDRDKNADIGFRASFV